MICWLKQTRWTLIGIVLAGLVTDARALDPNRLPSQYVREQWTTETRFPGGAVNGIAQTPDGYLWIGSDRGLIRFDGFNFKPVSFTPIASSSNVPILQLLTNAGGKLWIRPQGAYLVRQKDHKFESIRYGLPAITALSKDNHGGVLVSDIEQGTFRFTADDVQKLGPSSPPVISMAETADGKVWLGTLGDGLFFIAGGGATSVNAGLPDRKINSLLPIGEELWVGTDTGLYHGNSNGFRRFELPSFLGSVQVLSILRDRDSNMWVGTTRGLLRIDGTGVSYSEENELRGDGGINVLFEDREGNIWIGGARGLGRIRDSAFVTYSSVSDRRFEHDGPIYVDPEGRTWFAPAQGGLYVLQNGRVQSVTSIPANDVVYSISGRADVVWVGRQRGGLTRLRFRNGAIASQSYTEPNGLAQNSAYAVYESRDGSVWAGTLNGGVSKFKDGHFTTYTTTDGLASNTVSSILETRDGAMWFATPSGLSSFSNGQWRTYTTAEGMPSSEANCLFEDSSGTLWSGTSAGLAFFASNRFQVPRESPDFLREQIVGMAEDKSGRFWIATSHHVLRVPRDKLLSGAAKAVDIRDYDQADGLESTEGVKRSRSVVSDSAGRIWFSLSSGLSVVNPSQINDNSLPALPHIEVITADNNPVDLAASARIPPSPRRVTFEYTGLSLSVPGRIRFRYFLEGFDSSWSQPVAAREAVYTNLGPGSYRFRLVASNSEGLWDGPETAIAFNVAPAYYQTYWFRLSCIAGFFALLWALYRWRIHQLKGQEDRLRDAVETIPAMTFTALSNGLCTFVNKRWTEYTGLSIEQTSGAGWQRAIHPEDLVPHSEKWRLAVATGQLFEDEARFRRAVDGNYRWFLVRGVPLRDLHEKILRWYGTLTDIEDRKRAEEARQLLSRDLQESKARLEEAQSITHVGYWERDLATNRITWSDETYRIYGLRPQEDPIDLAALRQKIHPEDWKFVSQALDEALGGGARYDLEYRLLRPTGEVRIVHSNGDVKRDASGRPYKMFGTVQDITERKRAEEALELTSCDLQESKTKLEEAQRVAHVGHWVWDFGNDGLTWSDETYRIFGLQPQERPMNVEAFQEMIHPEDREFLLRATQESRSGGRPDIEFRIVRPNGEVRIVHSQGAMTKEVPGQPRQRFGTVQDITDRKCAEEELRRSQVYINEGQRIARMGSWAFGSIGFNYWSSELFRVHGLDPGGKPPTVEEYLALVHPEDRAFMKQGITKMLEDHLAFDFTKRIVRPDGEIRHVRCVGVPIMQGDIFQGFLGTGMDVTEQERLTEELRRSEQYLSEGQRLAHMGSWAFNPSGFFEYWSQELFNIYGVDAQKGAPTLEEYLATIHPQDRDVMADTIKTMIAERSGCDVTKRIVRAHGEQRYVRCVGIPVVEGEVLKGFLGTAIDVTEQELLTQELERRQAYLTEAQRLTHTGSWAINVRTDEHFWSEEVFRIYEFDPVKVKPTWSLILDRVHPDDRASLEQQKKMEFTQTGWADSQADLRIVVPGGKIKHLHTIAHPVMDASGQMIEIIGTTMDVTERKRAEDSLRRSESHLAEAQKLTHTASWAWRLTDRKAVHLSEEWYRIYGFDPAEGAPTLEEYFERVHPEDRLKWKGTTEQAIVEKADYDQEFRILLPNGIVKWIHSVGHPVVSDTGDLEQFVGSSTDITERKHAEEAVRSSETYLVEAQSLTHTGSCAIDGTSHETVYWSDEMFRLFDFDPQQGLPMFDQWLQRIHPEDRDKVRLASERTFLTKLNCDVEFRVVKPDGTVKHIHGVGHPVLSATGDLVQVLGTMVDVTERKLADEARDRLRQLEAELAHIDRVSTLGEMAASLAHEIKQPIAAAITSANSCIEWLAHEPPNVDRARTAAARIDKYGNRAAEIIDRIRSFYKKSPPQRELVDVNGIVHEMLTLLEGEASRFLVAMRTDLSAELPSIMVDRVQLQQVFMNLMLNAIEAMADSGGELTVKSHLQDGQLEFSVSDTGVGLPMEKMDQIFSAFFTTKPQGSGMGLAISRSIVESHGGRLWATANDGRGAAFHFTLPTEVQ
jgi:PAS domain S-box-containing protein